MKEKTSLGTKITREYKYTITQVDYVSRRATVCRGGDYYNCSKVESDLHISYGGKAALWGYELGDMGNGKSSAYFSFDDSSYDGNNGFISKTVTVKIEVYGGWISSRESIYGNSLAADMAVAIGDCISNCGTIGDLSFIGLNPWLAVMR